MKNFGLGVDETICSDWSRRAGASQSILAGRTIGTLEEEKEEGEHKENTTASKYLHAISSKKIIFTFNLFVHTHVGVCIFVCLCMHMCVPVHVCVCVYEYLYVGESMHTHMHLWNMCVCQSVSVYVCVRKSPDCDCVGQSTTGGCHFFLSPCGSLESDLFVRLDKSSFIP